MYTRVVVPVDGSLLAEEALPHAAFAARAFGVPLHLVRVVDDTPVAMHDPYGMPVDLALREELLAEEREDAKAYLAEKQAELAADGLEVTTELRNGPVVRELLAAAGDGDLYVMASHGRTGMTRWFLGSVAEDMTRRSRVPVMLVRAKERD